MNEQEKIENLVQDCLNGRSTIEEIDYISPKNAVDRYKLYCVKRLIHVWEKFQDDAKYQNDFLMALRDYLLVFDTQIYLNDALIPENRFGIVKDLQSGKFFCSFQFPNYINSQFAKEAFLQNWETPRVRDNHFDLLTDPQIYKTTGYTRFKSIAQKLAVYGALNTPDGYTTLVSLPTGGGKSLITQTVSYQKSGLTVIVMPTVSLAIDQVRSAKKTIKTDNPSIEIFAYYGGVNPAPILSAIQNKTARMLFISPESLISNQEFRTVIQEANRTRYLKNIIIDEAHIVVDWGASFRVDYQCLESWRAKLMLSNPTIRTILLSATYEQRCVTILKNFFSKEDRWIEVRCDALRHEPRFMLVKAKSYAEKNRSMVELVRKLPHPMIIYVARPVEAEQIQKLLQDHGIRNVETFTGETVGARRKELIEQWVNDEFQIMVATSAFGVGVDKNDVRTVLHMYLPQNANAYYQELGRGGRDCLPCLSVMCLQPEDPHYSFSRISKKVLTTEKISGRWDSMYTSTNSIRMENLIYMDTSVKPKYNVVDPFEDAPSSEADQNWNIYVLLLLRRYDLIKIHEVLFQSGKYIFIIEILNDLLRDENEHSFNLLDEVRTDEWNYFYLAYELMRKAIEHSEHTCWSEMFFETYDKVSEYCAGCNAHSEPNEGDFYEFPLKVPVRSPVKGFSEDQLLLFRDAEEIVVTVDKDKCQQVFSQLLKLRTAVFVGSADLETFLETSISQQNMMLVNWEELRELMKKSNYYYISGVVAVAYEGSEKEIFRQLRLVSTYLRNKMEIKIIHMVPKNVYFKNCGKNFFDLIDGPVIPAAMFCS